ncbi:MAG: YicC family protein [Alphaproteobacteria bacterium]|nr:YicC family protein [Alphaproteobacteria bacterium]
MAVASMTGFAAVDGAQGAWTWTWELRSVNGKGLDLRCRLPNGLDGLEPTLRNAAAKRFARGNVTAGLRLSEAAAEPTVRLNQGLLDRLIVLAGEIEKRAPLAPARIDGLLALRGVIEVGEGEASPEARAARDSALVASFDQALDALAKARGEEGARLRETVVGLIDEIERLTRKARGTAALQPDVLRARLKARLEELLALDPPVAEERLAQELALQVVKADVAEELDRLASHIAQARELIAAPEPAGRRFDFLAQEFNREANTLCSKSADTELTRIGLDLKLAIDRLREQAQNME